MQTATTIRLLALTLALTLAAPGFARGEVTQRTGVAAQGQTAAPPIQVIRSVKVSGAYPAEQELRTGVPQQKATKNQTKANANPNRAVKNTPGKTGSSPICAVPIRPVPIRTNVISTTSVPINTVRSRPIRPTPLRLNIKRA